MPSDKTVQGPAIIKDKKEESISPAFTFSDHQSDGGHKFGTELGIPVTVSPVNTAISTGSTGSSDSPAREDHSHGYVGSLVSVVQSANATSTGGSWSDIPGLSVTTTPKETGLYRALAIINDVTCSSGSLTPSTPAEVAITDGAGGTLGKSKTTLIQGQHSGIVVIALFTLAAGVASTVKARIMGPGSDVVSAPTGSGNFLTLERVV